MNIKNNQFWDDAMGEIDEKLIAEAAEAHAKNASKTVVDSAGAVDAGEPIVIPAVEKSPVSRKRMFITIGSIAAALVLCVGIGGVLINRFSQPIAPVTSGDDTSETSETDEGNDNSDNTDDKVQQYIIHEPIDTNFSSVVIRNAEDDDCYMQFDDSSVDRFKTAIGKFKDSEPVTDGSMLKPYAERASLSLYEFEPFEGESRVIKLYTDNDGYKEEYDRYYYGITSPAVAPYYTYYEVYFDDWVALLEMFGEVPMLMELTVVEDNGDGTYVAMHEMGEQTYLIPTEGKYLVGDRIDVCYYGMPLGEEPFTTNVLWTRYSYDINEDTSVIWDGTVRSDVDWNIFEKYFAGEWGNHGPTELVLSYAYDSFTNMTAWEGREFKIIACYELEDGYYLEYDYAADITEHTNLLYVPEKNTESMYLYTGYNSRTGSDALKNTEDKIEYYLDYDIPADDYALSLIGELGAIGRLRLGEILGEEYVEFSDELYQPYVEENGELWVIPDELPIMHMRYFYVKEYSSSGDSITVVQRYLRDDTLTPESDIEDIIAGYLSTTAQKKNGSWQITDRHFTNEYGESLTDRHDVTLYGEYTIHTRYDDDNGSVSGLHIYITPTAEDSIVLSDAVLENPHVKDGCTQLPLHLFDGLSIQTTEDTVNTGDFIAVRVPYEKDGTLRYCYTLYNTTPEGELVFIKGAFPDSTYTRVFSNPESNTVSFIRDGSVDTYRIDFSSNTMQLVEFTPLDIGNFALDTNITKVDPGLEGITLVSSQMLRLWGNEDGYFRIGSYSDEPFSYQDQCLGFYEDDNGVYSCSYDSEKDIYQLWFIPNADNRTLYRFDGVTQGMELMLSDYDECYQALYHDFSPMAGYGEKGYIGMMEYCAKRDITVGSFKLEITDDNGTRWLRDHSDLSKDWGYHIETVVNGQQSVQMKFMNTETGELKWLTLPYDYDWRGYFYTGEVYFLEPSPSSQGMATELSDYVRLQTEQSRYGWFAVDECYYTFPDGSYYLVSHMGNVQAQWLADSEVYYHNGSEWKLISDKYGLCHAITAGDKLFVLYNQEEAYSNDTTLAIDVYTGTTFNYTKKVGDGHTGYAGFELMGGYIVTTTGDGCYLLNSSAPNSKVRFTDDYHYDLETGDLIVTLKTAEGGSTVERLSAE